LMPSAAAAGQERGHMDELSVSSCPSCR
jgi:hypothetical protein